MGLPVHLFACESVALIIGTFYIIWFSGLLGTVIPFFVVVPSPLHELYLVYVQGRKLIDLRDVHYQVVSLATSQIGGFEFGQFLASNGLLPFAEALLPLIQLWLSPLLTTIVSVMLLRMVASGGKCPEEVLRYPPLQYPSSTTSSSTSSSSNTPPPVVVIGRTIVVAGAHGTAGFNLCRELIERAYSTGNLRLIVNCRSDEKCQNIVDKLRAILKDSEEKLGIHPLAVKALRESGAWRSVTIEHYGGCDFSNFTSVENYVAKLAKLEDKEEGSVHIDTIVSAVGIISSSCRYIENVSSSASTTKTSMTESQVATNAVGVHLFATSMMPLLRRTARRTGVPSRVVITASSCHRHLGFSILNKCRSPIELLNALHPPKMSSSPTKALNDVGRSIFGVNYVKIYGLSKLMNVYTTQHLTKMATTVAAAASHQVVENEDKKKSKQIADSVPAYYSTILPSDKEVFVTMCHPGVFVSTLYTEVVFGLTWIMNWVLRPISYLFFKTPSESAQTLLYLTTNLPPGSHPIPSMHVAHERQQGRIHDAISRIKNTITGSDGKIDDRTKTLLTSHILAFKDITTLSFFNTGKQATTTTQQQQQPMSSLTSSEQEAVKTLQTRHRSVQGGYYFDCKEYGATSPVAVCLSEHARDEVLGVKCVKWMESRIRGAVAAE